MAKSTSWAAHRSLCISARASEERRGPSRSASVSARLSRVKDGSKSTRWRALREPAWTQNGSSGSTARSPLSMRSKVLVLDGKVWEPHDLDPFQGRCPGELLRESQAYGTGEQSVEDPVPGVRRVGRVDGLHFLMRERARTIIGLGLP